MKKTLKILMAIILFAVVLTIATSVSAKSLESLVAEGKLEATTDMFGNVIYSVDGTLDASDEITVNGDKTVINTTVDNELSTTITVPAGKTLTLTGTAVISGKIVNNGTLVLKGSVAPTKIENAGKVEVPENTVVLGTDTIKITNASAEVVSVKPFSNAVETPSKEIGSKIEYSQFVNEDEGTQVCVLRSARAYSSYLVDEDGEKATELVPGKTYTVKVEGSYDYDGKTYELVAWSAEIRKVEGLTEEQQKYIHVTNTGDGLTEATKKVATVKIDDELKGVKFSLVIGTVTADNKYGDVKVNTITSDGTTEPTEPTDPTDPTEPTDPTDPTEPTNPEQPGNTDGDNKSDDLDESPKTGDHIIPATALLAVVVVANVVYFAKAKRS